MISNETQKVVQLPIKVIMANSFFSRFKGLMFRLKPLIDEGLFIRPCNSIHMCFMFFSIDVVFLDKQNRVVAWKEQLRPWQFVLPVRFAYSTLELPVGTIQKYDIQIGQVLKY